MTEATNNTSGLLRMVRSHGSVCWEEMDSESFEIYQQGSDYECREFYTAPPADNQGTTGDKYRAELYDEVWQKARDMGYGNVTEAMVVLERLRGAPPSAAVVMPSVEQLAEALNDVRCFHEMSAELIAPQLHENLARLNPAPVEQSAMVVPDGWKLVPIEPTPAMIEVALKWGTKKSEWEELLAAAPTPAQTEQQPIEVMLFQLKHPDGDARTVALTRSDISGGMEDTLFEKLGDMICDCQPVGETNVVDCNCDEYIYEFELVDSAHIPQRAPTPEQPAKEVQP